MLNLSHPRVLHVRWFEHSLCGFAYADLVRNNHAWTPATVYWDFVPHNPSFTACDACVLQLLAMGEQT